MEGLAGKVAIVTGAGRGIGQGVALALAKHGAKLVLNDLDQAPLDDTLRHVRAATGEAEGIAGSVTAPGLAESLAAKANERFGGVDIVITCAGFTWDVMFHRMTDEQWNAIIDVHLNGTYRVTHEAFKAMRTLAQRERDAGRMPTARKVVTVSSMSSFGNLGQANYAAAKAGIVGLTRSIALEGAAFNILANSVAFGPMDTRLTRPRESQREQAGGSPLGIPTAAREKYLAQVPLGRVGTIDEAVGPLLFLASSHAGYVSGALLEVNGGAHIS
jgi:3-oxoacyl-[acyl-carrier protein] reductase